MITKHHFKDWTPEELREFITVMQNAAYTFFHDMEENSERKCKNYQQAAEEALKTKQ